VCQVAAKIIEVNGFVLLNNIILVVSKICLLALLNFHVFHLTFGLPTFASIFSSIPDLSHFVREKSMWDFKVFARVLVDVWETEIQLSVSCSSHYN